MENILDDYFTDSPDLLKKSKKIGSEINKLVENQDAIVAIDALCRVLAAVIFIISNDTSMDYKFLMGVVGSRIYKFINQMEDRKKENEDGTD